jgi:DNA-binding FadR family transcriptional regulator
VLEAEMAREAAMRSTAEDREDMRRLLGQLTTDAATPDRHMLTDLEFHDAIMRASRNRLGRAIVRAVHSEARTSDRYNGYPARADCEASDIGHAQIYDRIVEGDPEGAATAMSQHIARSWLARRDKP